MVPPPDTTGDEFPDFDNMTLEEQMAWLESLAKRQGVSNEQLTTSADLDIPIPENATVDEPGYVPFEGSRTARLAEEAAKKAKQAAASPEPEVPAPEAYEFEDEAADLFSVMGTAADADLEDEVAHVSDFAPGSGDAMDDPMRWLDSLAAQSGEDAMAIEGVSDSDSDTNFDWLGEDDELQGLALGQAETETTEDDEASYLDMSALSDDEEAFDIFDLDDTQRAVAEPEAAVESSPGDFLDGMDPMAWLETLAARQGVNPEELTTSADLQIAEVADDAFIDEPGYVPPEGSRSARILSEMAREESIVSQPVIEPEDVEAFPETGAVQAETELEQTRPPESTWEFEAELGEVVPGLEDILDEEPGELESVESSDWLESLPKLRKEVPEEPALPDLDLGLAETFSDDEGEPALVDSEDTVAFETEANLFESDAAQSEAEFGFGSDFSDEALSWLEDLATEPEEGISEFLVVEDEDFDSPETAPAPEIGIAEIPQEAVSTDLLAGMTDEEIAYAQAHGELTGEQELEWLKQQAARLAEARAGEETEVEESVVEDVAPAQPVDALPDWLQGMRPEDSEIEGEISEILSMSESGMESFDWADELGDADALESEGASVPSAELTLEGDLETLWPNESEADSTTEGMPLVESELEAFLDQGLATGEVDPLAEALDAEYERGLVGDETEPEWYTQAVEIVSQEPTMPLEETPVDLTADETVLSEASLVDDMPDWLLARDEAESVVEGEQTAEPTAPDWLQETDESAPVAAGEAVPDWLAGDYDSAPGSAGVGDEEPDWLNAFDQPQDEGDMSWLSTDAQTPAPEPIAETPVPAARVEQEIAPRAEPQPIPAGELFETYRSNLEQNSEDHVSRLALARALRTNREVVASLDQYESLIESAQLLQDVTDDLSVLVEEQTEMPRAHRLLGDVYVRRGMLRDALDAYRSALDQL